MGGVVVPKLTEYRKTVDCAPDKSVSVRAVIFNGYATGSATVKNISRCADVMSAAQCMRELGASVRFDGDSAHITGAAFRGAKLNCGNSATTARLLIGLLSGLNGVFELDGDTSLRARPMRRVTDPLREMGAEITDTDGRLPIKIIGAPLKGGEFDLTVPSAQVKSALLLAGLNASGTVRVTEKAKTRDHTEILLREMNGRISADGNTVTVAPSVIYARDMTVVGDASAAVYPVCLALGINGGACKIKNVGLNPTRTAVFDVLRASGANIKTDNVRGGAEPCGDVTAEYGVLRPITVSADVAPSVIDEIPALCALACAIDGVSEFAGVGELRVKETDRIFTTVAALKSLGADISATADKITVRGGKRLLFGEVDARGDHRIAMAASVAGAIGAGAYIADGECVAVSYPDFFKEVIGV